MDLAARSGTKRQQRAKHAPPRAAFLRQPSDAAFLEHPPDAVCTGLQRYATPQCVAGGGFVESERPTPRSGLPAAWPLHDGRKWAVPKQPIDDYALDLLPCNPRILNPKTLPIDSHNWFITRDGAEQSWCSQEQTHSKESEDHVFTSPTEVGEGQAQRHSDHGQSRDEKSFTRGLP